MNNFMLQSQLIDKILENEKITDVKKSYKQISEKYREEKINSSIVLSNEKLALSYLASRMGETSNIIYDVFDKLNAFFDLNDNINSVLDLGSGTGSVFWALDNFNKTAKITAIEKQESMIKYSKMLAKDLDFDITYINEDVLSEKVKNLEIFNLVIESFMLNELSKKDREKVLELMYEKTNDLIVLIEPGTPTSYKRMMEDREFLLKKGMNIILPCPHEKQCPLINDYCNFSVRMNRTKTSTMIKDATLNYEDEKYFYLIFSKNIKGSLHKSVVLRKPVYRKKLVELKLCNDNNQISNTIITKNNKDIYSISKKLKHGDVINK